MFRCLTPLRTTTRRRIPQQERQLSRTNEVKRRSGSELQASEWRLMQSWFQIFAHIIASCCCTGGSDGACSDSRSIYKLTTNFGPRSSALRTHRFWRSSLPESWTFVLTPRGAAIILQLLSMARKTDPSADDWRNVEDAKKRKQIQDRLAQRARRKLFFDLIFRVVLDADLGRRWRSVTLLPKKHRHTKVTVRVMHAVDLAILAVSTTHEHRPWILSEPYI